MSIAAAEAAAPAAEGGAGAGSSGAGGAAAGALGSGGGPLPAGDVREKSKGVLLAIAVVLLWLAGLAFFIALEGSALLTEQSAAGGAGFFQGIVSGLQSKVAAAAGGGATAGEGGTGAGEGSGGSLGG